MKFTVFVPKSDNDGTPFEAEYLRRVIDRIWQPFQAMTEEGEVIGRWTNDHGILFTDICIKISIECDRDRLWEAIRLVRQAGRRLRQEAMYFEVQGYDGVQFLRIAKRA